MTFRGHKVLGSNVKITLCTEMPSLCNSFSIVCTHLELRTLNKTFILARLNLISQVDMIRTPFV